MYFDRTFTSGPSYDPRSKKFAEYKCSICGHIECIDITFSENKHNFKKLIPCKKCGQLDSEDMTNQIKTEINELIKTINLCESKKEKLQKQLNELK